MIEGWMQWIGDHAWVAELVLIVLATALARYVARGLMLRLAKR